MQKLIIGPKNNCYEAAFSMVGEKLNLSILLSPKYMTMDDSPFYISSFLSNEMHQLRLTHFYCADAASLFGIQKKFSVCLLISVYRYKARLAYWRRELTKFCIGKQQIHLFPIIK